jgi:uncharacterized protein YcgL (UPF0745 family)
LFGRQLKRLVIVYRSPKITDMYLYVDAIKGLDPVPESLLSRFGEPVEALRFALTPERALARAETTAVLDALADHGFYLQLPPSPEAWQEDR